MKDAGERETQIVAVLDSLGRAIRAAEFTQIEEISAVLETHSQDLSGLDRTALTRIRGLAARNAACLAASAQGIRAGRRRLAEIGAAGRVDTYDRSGTRQALSLQSSGRRL
jgi:hypothetical protein